MNEIVVLKYLSYCTSYLFDINCCLFRGYFEGVRIGSFYKIEILP